MPTLDTTYLTTALAAAESPCVSVYLPTHRSFPDQQQNPIRFKNLVGQVEAAIEKSHPGPAGKAIVEKLRQMESDEFLWKYPLDGVAILASPARFDVFKLPRTMPERAEVGETFHVKPLIRHVQSGDRFHVLGLSRDRAALFEGNRYVLDLLDVPGVPLTITEALGEETTEPYLDLHTTGQGPGQFHGQGGRKDDVLLDLHRFFRVVDQSVIDRVSEPTGMSIVPVAAEDNLAEFRAVTKNRHLTADGVTGDWTKWNANEIREKAWKVFERMYLAEQAKIREDFGTALARGQATGDLSDAARSAVGGRVGILLIDADRTIPGAIDMTTGELRPAAANDATAGDMLDDLAELGLKSGAQVIVTPSANLPTDTGLAAIYRY